MLTHDSVVGYLIERHVLDAPGPGVTVEALTGGVSNDVFAVTDGHVNLVLKQAMSKLAVKEEWYADPLRILVEAHALETASNLTPEAVPAVLDIDEDALVICIARAPEHWRNWKDDLLAGDTRDEVAGFLGRSLAVWHSETAGDQAVASRFDASYFESLRIDPYYRVAAGRNPVVADQLEALATELVTQKLSLVHGDFSPKNVLTDGLGGWVLDWEVAHYGHPVFDVAFLQTHLLLKSIRRPQSLQGYLGCAQTFTREYTTRLSNLDESQYSNLARHIGALLLARIDGKSPVDYLTVPQRSLTRSIALTALQDPAVTVETLWSMLPNHVA
ncbi:phosphotransferase family protein [Rhodococcus sp. NPDC055112]